MSLHPAIGWLATEVRVSSRTASAALADGSTSSRLLALAGRGDEGALALLVARCLPDVRCGIDTGDLVQDAALRILSRLNAFQPQGRRALAAYLRATVQNRIADEHRRAARWVVSETRADELPANGPSPLHHAIRAETERRYRAALARHAQLGCMIGRSTNAARMALARAIGRLAGRMQGR
jgi:hypothetical protein